MTDAKDHIEAIAIGVETLGFDIGSSFERRAKASLIEQALKLCGYSVVPLTQVSRDPKPAPQAGCAKEGLTPDLLFAAHQALAFVARLAPVAEQAEAERRAEDFKKAATALSVPPPPPVAEREWRAIETAPLDDSEIWISNGKTVWLGTAHKDGSLKLPSRSECKFWMPAHKPAPPLLAEQGGK